MTAEIFNWTAVARGTEMIVTGKCLNHKTLPNYSQVRTSHIVRAFMSGIRLCVVTRSGTVYKLGMPDPGWLKANPSGRWEFQSRFESSKLDVVL